MMASHVEVAILDTAHHHDFDMHPLLEYFGSILVLSPWQAV
jgi:hypothetical protein